MIFDLAVISCTCHQKQRQQKERYINWISPKLKTFVYQNTLLREWKGKT